MTPAVDEHSLNQRSPNLRTFLEVELFDEKKAACCQGALNFTILFDSYLPHPAPHPRGADF